MKNNFHRFYKPIFWSIFHLRREEVCARGAAGAPDVANLGQEEAVMDQSTPVMLAPPCPRPTPHPLAGATGSTGSADGRQAVGLVLTS